MLLILYIIKPLILPSRRSQLHSLYSGKPRKAMYSQDITHLQINSLQCPLLCFPKHFKSVFQNFPQSKRHPFLNVSLKTKVNHNTYNNYFVMLSFPITVFLALLSCALSLFSSSALSSPSSHSKQSEELS